METITEATDTRGPAAFTPPMPPLARDHVGALGVLAGLRRNAYSAFPPRCREQGVVVLPMPGRDVVVAAGPQAMRDVLATRPELYVSSVPSSGVAWPPARDRLGVGSAGSWHRPSRPAP
jgi:hypothetical protein